MLPFASFLDLRTIIALLLSLFGFGVCGCGVLHPQTKVWGGVLGWGFSDGKDNDVSIKGARYNPDTHEFAMDELTIVNSASRPIAANVEQLRLVNEQIRIHGENIAQSLALITALAEKVLPGLSVPRPASGIGSGANLDLILRLLSESKAAPAVAPVTP